MQPVSQGVNALDLQKIRQQNEDSLQSRATNQLGAELKKGADSTVSEEEKLTAGEQPGDQVQIKTPSRVSTPNKGSGDPSKSGSSKSGPSTKGDSPSSSSSPSPSSQSGNQQPQPGKIEYTDSQKQFLARLEELNQQAKTLRDMWRKMYMDYMEDQMKAREDMENFRQSTMLLWTDISVSRWVQGARHAEAVRGLL